MPVGNVISRHLRMGEQLAYLYMGWMARSSTEQINPQEPSTSQEEGNQWPKIIVKANATLLRLCGFVDQHHNPESSHHADRWLECRAWYYGGIWVKSTFRHMLYRVMVWSWCLAWVTKLIRWPRLFFIPGIPGDTQSHIGTESLLRGQKGGGNLAWEYIFSTIWDPEGKTPLRRW